MMKFCVSILAAGAAGGVALMGAASAQSFNVACVKGADERTIEIVSPGDVGAACDVQYARGGATRTPYHANNSSGFCQEKATEIVSTLITSGFACGQIGGPLTAEARPEPGPAPEPEAPAPATTNLAQPAPAPETEPEPALQANEIAATPEPAPAPTPAPVPAPADEVADIVAPAFAPVETAETVAAAVAPPRSAPETPVEPEALVGAAPIEEPFTAAPSPVRLEATPVEPVADIVAPEPEPVARADEPELLAEPSVDAVATRGPATLAGDNLETLSRAAEPVPTGRIIGAAPTPQLAPSAHANQSPAGGGAEPATTVTPAAVVASAPARPETTRSSPLRDPQEIIVATLQAQAAAWNEGNLQAFMDIYWKDEDLKFVSGTAITKGWSQTMKRYRERYADDAGLGQLSFERTDVEMVTDDVAVVTGRFNHVKNEEASSGVFSLVMRRINGVWRIVHDHTAGDPPKN